MKIKIFFRCSWSG